MKIHDRLSVCVSGLMMVLLFLNHLPEIFLEIFSYIGSVLFECREKYLFFFGNNGRLNPVTYSLLLS